MEIVRNSKRLGTNLQFSIVRQQEPKKKLWNAGDRATLERIAYAAVYDMGSNLLWELVISLTRKTVISAMKRPDQVPPITEYEYSIARELAAADSRVIFAYEVRGLNASYAKFDVWPFGSQGPNGNIPGRRRVMNLCNYADPETK